MLTFGFNLGRSSLVLCRFYVTSVRFSMFRLIALTKTNNVSQRHIFFTRKLVQQQQQRGHSYELYKPVPNWYVACSLPIVL